MLKKLLSVVVLTVFLIGTFTAQAETNLLTNGDFETDGTGQTPSGWVEEAFQPGSEYAMNAKKTHGGKAALMINSPQENDVRMIQSIPVKPNTYYRLSGYIATENLPKPAANLCVVAADFYHSPLLSGTTDWTYVEFNFRTHAKQNEVKIGARLGMWGNTVTGTAYFDDLSLVELTEAPAGAMELKDENAPAASQASKKALGSWVWLIPAALVIIAAVLFLEKKKKR